VRQGRHQSGPGFALWLVLAAGVNVLALIVVNALFDKVWISGFWSYALGALALTIGNGLLKPVLALLTLPLVIISLGLSYFALNVAMLGLAEWVAPDFSIDGFWTYVWATIVVWFCNVVLWWLFNAVGGHDKQAA